MSEHSTGIEPTRIIIKNIPTKAEIDAFVQSMDNCFIDTADYDAVKVLARNTGAAQDLRELTGELLEKIHELTAEATGEAPGKTVFVLDSLSALEDKNADKRN